MINIKVLLTSRTHYFLSEAQEKEVLRADYTILYRNYATKSNYEIARINLKEFSQEQIEEYVFKNTRDEKATRDILAIIKDTYNLEELSTRPLLLEMIVKTLPTLENKKGINAADLYRAYTGIWIERDDWRSQMTPEGKRAFMWQLALKMFKQDGDFSLHYRRLRKPQRKHLKKNFEKRDREYYKYEVTTCTFLNRDSKGYYKFIHKSFMEYFMAEYFFNSARRSRNRVVDHLELNEEMYYFLKLIIESNKADLAGFNLSGLDLEEVDLSEAKLVRADLRGADLWHANLDKSDLRRANLSRAELVEASLGRADLRRADLSEADLSRADLSAAILIGANLYRMDLTDANLSGADLSQTDLRKTRLGRVDFRSSILRQADLSSLDLSGIDFSNADLSDARLCRAKLSDADLSGANLSGADLSEADLQMADLSMANLKGTKFWGTDLSATIITETDLRSADLRGVDVWNTDSWDDSLSGVDFLDEEWMDVDDADDDELRDIFSNPNFPDIE